MKREQDGENERERGVEEERRGFNAQCIEQSVEMYVLIFMKGHSLS